MSECSICCSPYTSALRRPVCCKFCRSSVCSACVKSYLLSITTDPKCMHCFVGWDQEFLDSVLSRNFRIGDFKRHRENVLFERERSLLPSTMPLVEIELSKKKNEEELNRLQNMKTKLLQQIQVIDLQIFDLRCQVSNHDKCKSKCTYIRPCPTTDCRGFINNLWQCDICKLSVCKECHITKSDNHVCKKEDIESVQLIEKDSKTCPSCGVLVFKKDGCRQVWCTQCHVAFDYITGNIDNGVIHSPDYYEWLEKEGTNIKEVPNCDDVPDYWTLNSHIKQHNFKIDFYTYQRSIRHIQQVELPSLIKIDHENSDLRIKYLLKNLSEDAFKKELIKRENKIVKNKSHKQLFDLVIKVSCSLLYKVLESKQQSDIDILICEFERIRCYFNDQMKKLALRYLAKSKKQLDKAWFVIIC